MNPVPLSTSSVVPASTPRQGKTGTVNESVAVLKNQNYGKPMGMQMQVVGEQTNQQPLEQQARGVQKDVPPNLCCFCELRTGLTVMAVVDILFQAYDWWILYRGRTLFASRVGEIPINLEMYFVAEFFFRTLTVTVSLMLLVFNCMENKVLTTVSHVIGWIPLLASYIYTSVFLSKYMILDSRRPNYTAAFILGVIIVLCWRSYESIVVYYCWNEIPGQYAQRRNQGYTGGYVQTGGYAAQPNYGYPQPVYGNYGGYAQPGYYGGYGGYAQPAAGAGGYSGFGQPGYGQSSGYGGYATPPPPYGHYAGYGRM